MLSVFTAEHDTKWLAHREQIISLISKATKTDIAFSTEFGGSGY